MPTTRSGRTCTDHARLGGKVYLKLTVVDDVLIVSFKEL